MIPSALSEDPCVLRLKKFLRSKWIVGLFSAIAVIGIVYFYSTLSFRELYNREGNALGTEIERELRQHGFVIDRKYPFEMEHEHGNRVNFAIFAPDKRAVKVIFDLLIDRGITVTEGVPISIRIYPQPRKYYMDKSNSKEKTPAIILEIEK